MAEEYLECDIKGHRMKYSYLAGTSHSKTGFKCLLASGEATL
jgi:hypothetical protein